MENFPWKALAVVDGELLEVREIANGGWHSPVPCSSRRCRWSTSSRCLRYSRGIAVRGVCSVTSCRGKCCCFVQTEIDQGYDVSVLVSFDVGHASLAITTVILSAANILVTVVYVVFIMTTKVAFVENQVNGFRFLFFREIGHCCILDPVFTDTTRYDTRKKRSGGTGTVPLAEQKVRVLVVNE